MISDRAFTVLISVVTGVWVMNIVGGIFAINGYRPSESINGIFMTIVGGAIILRAKNRGDDE